MAHRVTFFRYSWFLWVVVVCSLPIVDVAALSRRQTETPSADGSIVHMVQEGDTLWSIAIQYAPALGLTPEEALAQIQALNNNPTFINLGDAILVAFPSATPTPLPTFEPTTAVVVETAVPLFTPTPRPNGICVAAFNDVNGDGQHDSSESYLPEAVFTILRGGNTVVTYISTGLDEPYCFTELLPDTYQIQFSPPPAYQLTTTDSWALALVAGRLERIKFGAQPAPPTAVPTDSPATTLLNPIVQEDGGFTNIGTIVLGAVVVLLLLAVVVVLLLRRA